MDMERYGDYNEYEEDLPKSKNPILLVIKILIIVVCVAVAGVLIFRVAFFNFYPKSIKSLYFDEKLTEYYEASGGNISVKTQKIRAKYDDNKVAKFFCDNLYVIDEISQIQLSIRYTNTSIDHIEKEFSLSGLDPKDPELFTYKLACWSDEAQSIVYLDASVVPVQYETKLMYHYYKLVCNNVPMDGLNQPSWLRLEVFVKGREEKIAQICVYENHNEYSTFENYELKSEDKPK